MATADAVSSETTMVATEILVGLIAVLVALV
jgi:hypothetical protein